MPLFLTATQRHWSLPPCKPDDFLSGGPETSHPYTNQTALHFHAYIPRVQTFPSVLQEICTFVHNALHPLMLIDATVQHMHSILLGQVHHKSADLFPDLSVGASLSLLCRLPVLAAAAQKCPSVCD